MKILLDEGLPRRAAALLRDRGIDAVHLTEIAAASTADHVILERALGDGRIIVTLDADFHALLAVAGSTAPSVIRIRREGLSAEDVRDLLLHLLRDHEAALLSGVALSVRAHLVGMRRLPLIGPLSEPDDPESDE
jgi:predicted nuclease of predicted toxin-antitoxin system